MTLYDEVGVVRPTLDPQECTRRSLAFQRLATGLESAQTTAVDATAAVTATNAGPGVDSFKTSMLGSGWGIAPHLEQLALAARKTSQAHATAAETLATTVVTMDACVLRSQQALDAARGRYFEKVLRGFAMTDLADELTALESSATATIQQAFSGITLPQSFDNTQEYEGRVDPRIAEEWPNLPPAERKRILQRMADEYADAHGLDRVTLVFDDTRGAWGDTTPGPPPMVRIDAAKLSDPHLLHTTVHEMEHVRQFAGMGQLGPGYRPGDMTPEEGRRLAEMNTPEVQRRGVTDGYTPRPIEVGARRAGRAAVDQMSYADFQRLRQ